jgi:tRNA (guanine37-N1)-methyltransferase
MNVLLPSKVLEMPELNREKFRKTIQVPQINFDPKIVNIQEITPVLKPFYLKMERLKPVQKEIILLNPNAVKCFEDLPSKLKDIRISAGNFQYGELTLTYDNFRCDEIIKAILPDNLEPITSFSRIGHIVHLNLRDHLLPFKTLIGQIIQDKVVGCKTVINKAQTIDNTYRNFQIELLAGEPKYEVQTKENGCTFEFDFSQVYWNPRLSSEHERMVKMVNRGDVFYDVFAGVGPFSIPAGKKKVKLCLANDLNPASHKWLAHNVKKNKVSDNVKTFMKDGRDFIKIDVKADLLERIKAANTEKPDYKIHIAMNLPAMAVEFLDAS